MEKIQTEGPRRKFTDEIKVRRLYTEIKALFRAREYLTRWHVNPQTSIGLRRRRIKYMKLQIIQLMSKYCYNRRSSCVVFLSEY